MITATGPSQRHHLGAGIGARAHGRYVELRAPVRMVSDDAATTWVHLAYEGQWLGHPDGDFEFRREHFEQILKNFEATKNPTPFTYEHGEMPGMPRPASGWIHELKVHQCKEHGLELWASVEFTERAAEMVRAGEYRFCSVVVDFMSEDRETAEERGAELHEVGLTNTPFLDGQHPIQLSRRTRRRRALAMPEIQDLIKEAQDALPDGATPEQFLRVFEQVVKKHSAASGGSEGEQPEGEEQPMSKDKSEAAEASDKPEDETTTEASADTSEDTTTEATESTEDGETRELAEDDATREMLVQEAMGIAEALGTDLAGLTALMQEQRESIVAALQGAAESDGGEAEGEPAAAMSAARKVDAAELRALRKQAADKDAESKKLSKRLDEAQAQIGELQIDALIRDGVFLAEERDELIQLRHEAPKAFEKRLERGKKAPAVPQGGSYQQAPPDGEAADVDKDKLDALTESLMRLSRYKGKPEAARTRALEQLKSNQAQAS